jgi:uncharacterized protein (DUF1501 family)
LLSRWAVASPAPPAARARAKSVILIFNSGAPSHIDLWDPKPLANADVRGEFTAIATRTPGIFVSELLPELAARTDRLAILRSVSHQHSGHNSGMHWSIVGRPYKRDDTLIHPSRTDLPCVGALTGWLAERDGYSGGLPPYVITPQPHNDGPYVTPGQFGGCLGARFDPLVLNADPNAANFKLAGLDPIADLDNVRLAGRRSVLAQLDKHRRFGAAESFEQLDQLADRAAAMVQSGDARRAFDLSAESDATRERYGRHTWGQSHLLARRLIEAGVKFVTTVNGPGIIWDTHSANFEALRKRLVPPMQQSFVALLDDLSERGLLDSTLVVWMGDFGRSPKINTMAGRDHWPQCYSMVLAGGGIRGGVVVGESDAKGAYPASRPLTPADVHATIFTALGYDPHGVSYTTLDGRPMLLCDGQPIQELL